MALPKQAIITVNPVASSVTVCADLLAIAIAASANNGARVSKVIRNSNDKVTAVEISFNDNLSNADHMAAIVALEDNPAKATFVSPGGAIVLEEPFESFAEDATITALSGNWGVSGSSAIGICEGSSSAEAITDTRSLRVYSSNVSPAASEILRYGCNISESPSPSGIIAFQYKLKFQIRSDYKGTSVDAADLADRWDIGLGADDFAKDWVLNNTGPGGNFRITMSDGIGENNQNDLGPVVADTDYEITFTNKEDGTMSATFLGATHELSGSRPSLSLSPTPLSINLTQQYSVGGSKTLQPILVDDVEIRNKVS